MTNREIVSRISNQLRMITKDDYISDRFVLYTAKSVAEKFIAQRIRSRGLDRDMSLYTEVPCIEFEPVDVYSCQYVDFRSCDELSKSKYKIEDLIFTRYGSSIKELYSIDRKHNFTESTLNQYRNNSKRKGYKPDSSFYLLDGYIYIPEKISTLNGLVLSLDQYNLDQISDCKDGCKSAWDYKFICPSGILEDTIAYTVQSLSITKSIPEDESPNLNNNEK